MRISLITVCHRSRENIADYARSFLQYHSANEDRAKYQFVFIENSGEVNFERAIHPLVDGGFEVKILRVENEGFGRACNAGALEATGDLLLFANPDIRFLGNLGALHGLTTHDTWGTLLQITSKGSEYSIDLLPEYKGLLFEIFQLHRLINRYPAWFLRRSYVVGSFIIISNNLFARSGGFNPTFFLYYEEAELARRLQTLSGPPTLCRSISVFHEGFGSHSSRDDILKHEATGFLTYCRVTRQPELIRRQLRTLQILSLISVASRKRYKILRAAASMQNV